MITGELYKIDFDSLLKEYEESTAELYMEGINLTVIDEHDKHKEICNFDIEDILEEIFFCLGPGRYVNLQNSIFEKSHGGHIFLWKNKKIYCGPNWKNILIKIT